MSAGNWLRLFLVAAGAILIWMTLASSAKRKFTDQFCMLWGVLAGCMVLGGVLLSPTELTRYISGTGLLLVLIIFTGVLYMAWCFSREISSLTRKNQELAMQLSLLNQEHDRVEKLLEELTRKSGDELWR